MSKTVLVGDPILRKKALPVAHDQISSVVEKHLEEMVRVMRDANLVGLAAPQIGVPLQMFILEIREDNTRSLRPHALEVYTNPIIHTVTPDVHNDWEGCGSIPDLYAMVTRPIAIELGYYDHDGIVIKTRETGFVARIIQHEIDHLNGILFTDKADMSTLMHKTHYLERIVRK